MTSQVQDAFEVGLPIVEVVSEMLPRFMPLLGQVQRLSFPEMVSNLFGNLLFHEYDFYCCHICCY